MSSDSTSNPLYVIFAGLDADALPRWLEAAAQRFAGHDYYPVQIGGEGALICSRFDCPKDAATTFVGRQMRGLFMVVPDKDDAALAAFTIAGFNPRFVYANKHTPEAWAALGALQPGNRAA